MIWLAIIAFNIVFGFFSGYITSRVFNRRDGDVKWYLVDRDDKQMILSVAMASNLAAMLCYLIFPKQPSGWMWIGLNFGNMVPAFTIFFIYLSDQYQILNAEYQDLKAKYDALNLGPKSGIISLKRKLFLDLYHSFSLPGLILLPMITVLYGWIFLLVPILGLTWGYLMYNCLL